MLFLAQIDLKCYNKRIKRENKIRRIDSSTELTLKLIEPIVVNCEFVESPEGMVKTFGIWNIEHANSLFKIITKVCEN